MASDRCGLVREASALARWPGHNDDLVRRGIPAEELTDARLWLLDAVPRGAVFVRQAVDAMERLYERAGFGRQFRTTVKPHASRLRRPAREWAEECLRAAREAIRRAGAR